MHPTAREVRGGPRDRTWNLKRGALFVTGPVTASGTFNSGKKGQITACLTINVPSPTESPCSGPLTLTLTDISYSNIALEDLTTPVGPVAATPSTLSAVVFVCPF